MVGSASSGVRISSWVMLWVAQKYFKMARNCIFRGHFIFSSFKSWRKKVWSEFQLLASKYNFWPLCCLSILTKIYYYGKISKYIFIADILQTKGVHQWSIFFMYFPQIPIMIIASGIFLKCMDMAKYPKYGHIWHIRPYLGTIKLPECMFIMDICGKYIKTIDHWWIVQVYSMSATKVRAKNIFKMLP